MHYLVAPYKIEGEPATKISRVFCSVLHGIGVVLFIFASVDLMLKIILNVSFALMGEVNTMPLLGIILAPFIYLIPSAFFILSAIIINWIDRITVKRLPRRT